MIVALKNEKKYILLILLCYLLSQGLVLVISGLWYDDWCLVNISSEGLKRWAMEMGRPEVYPIFTFINHIPEFVFRFIVFCAYFLVDILFFMIAKKCFSLESKDALCLALIYLCVPANDIRIAHTVIPYALGLLFFFIAFCLLVYKYDELVLGYRVTILLLFFFSYILNSMLVFMGIVWLYIIIREKSIIKIIKKIDFFGITFLYFIINKIFFPTQGVYSEYNGVTVDNAIRALGETFRAESSLMSQIITFFFDGIIKNPYMNIIVFVATWWMCKYRLKYKNKRDDCESKDMLLKTTLMEAFIGFIALFAGMFPYVVVNNEIVITGFDSRNVILAPFGLSLIIHSIFKIGLKKEYRCTILLLMLVTSSVHFFDCYSNYQCIYYRDRGLQEYLVRNEELKYCKNIGIIEGDGGASWYIYNGMFEEVYGDESRLVENINHTMTVDPLVYSACIDREWYNMTECDISYTDVDCVIIYNSTITPRQALVKRIKEVFGASVSEGLINNSDFRVVYPSDEEFSNYISQ